MNIEDWEIRRLMTRRRGTHRIPSAQHNRSRIEPPEICIVGEYCVMQPYADTDDR